MPLARIITESIDESLELSMQLRARGFRVETVSPDQIPETPADLEVRLEECAPEDVLTKAAYVTESEDLWVFVAPGALDERGRPMRSKSLVQPEIEWSDPERPPLPAKSEPPANAPTPPKDDAGILAELGFAWPKNIVLPDTRPANSHPATPSEVPEGPVAPALEVASGNGNGTANLSPAKVKVVVLPKRPETVQIPEVPERAQPFVAAVPQVQVQVKPRFAGPYKIAFRTGSGFWKKAAVSAVLGIMVSVLALVLGVRPPLPSASKPATVPVPAQKPATTTHSSGIVPAPKTAESERARSGAGASAAKTAAAGMETHPTAPGQQHPAAAVRTRPAATVQARPADHPHPPGWVSDREIIAEDTVVFYDRKPAVHSRKTAGVKPRSDKP